MSTLAPESTDNASDTLDTLGPAPPLERFDTSDPREADWSFLNGDPVDDSYDPNETIEEYAARMVKEAEEADKNKTETKTDDKGKTEASQADDKKTPDDAPKDVEPTEAEMVKTWKAFDTAFRQDPAIIANVALKAMTDQQKAAFIKSLGVEASATPQTDSRPDIDAESYTPESEAEAALVARWGDIKAIPEMQKQLTDLASTLDSRMSAKIRELDTPMGVSIAQGEIALTKLEFLLEAIGLDLPSPEMEAIAAKLQDGRTTMKSAVRALVGDKYKQAVAAHKQTKAPRPQTPGNSSTRTETLKPGSSMLEVARHLGQV